MKNPISRLITGYRKLTAPYDVPEDHAFSKKSMEEQRVIQEAASFISDYTKRVEESRNATVSDGIGHSTV